MRSFQQVNSDESMVLPPKCGLQGTKSRLQATRSVVRHNPKSIGLKRLTPIAHQEAPSKTPDFEWSAATLSVVQDVIALPATHPAMQRYPMNDNLSSLRNHAHRLVQIKSVDCDSKSSMVSINDDRMGLFTHPAFHGDHPPSHVPATEDVSELARVPDPDL